MSARLAVVLIALSAAPAGAAPAERGVCYAHAWGRGGRDGYGTETSAHTRDRLQRLGVDSISLMPYALMRTVDSPIVMPAHAAGETDERLRTETRAAHARGLRVVLKPNIWILGDAWPGALVWKSEAAFEAWFASLREMALRYARLAAEEKIDQYLFGTELKSATARAPERFRSLIAEIRAIYPARGARGELGYAANWDEADAISFWDALDLVAVDVYRPLSQAERPSDAQLSEGARRLADELEALARRTRKPLVIAELGYRASVEAARQPATWPEHDRAAVDLELQARCYQATLAALWDRPWLRGLYVWKWFTDGRDEHGPRDYPPTDKPAEAVLRSYFTRPRGAR
jgi:hypothetical protein